MGGCNPALSLWYIEVLAPFPDSLQGRSAMKLHLLLISLAILTSTRAQADAPPPPKWLMEITRVAYTDLPNRQPQGAWPDQFIADLAAAKVQLLFSRVHSGEGWQGLGWKSDYGDPDPAMKGEDGTRHIVKLCHDRGIRYLGYYWAQREPLSVGEAHPDWKCVNSRGKATGYYCVNNPEYRTLVRNRVVELVQKVGCDGVFFDMFHARADECYCPACKSRFKAQAGQDPPLKEDFDSRLWQQWVEFKYRTLEEAMLDFNRALKAARPDAALVVNTWNAWVYRNGGNLRNSIRVIENVDALLEEIGWYDTVDPSFFAFPTHYSFMDWHLAGLCKNKRAFMWSSPSYLRTRPLGATEATIRVMAMMTNGSVPAQSVPGRDVMRKYMEQIAERDEYFRADRLVPWCGLVVSEKTELWYGREDPKGRYIQGVYGAFQAMLERHLPVSMVTDRELERGELDQYKVLFMPNCAAMSDAELETIRRFVHNGGGLVATYETSAYDEHAKSREKLGLADLFQARPVGNQDLRQIRMDSSGKPANAAMLYLPSNHRWGEDSQLDDVVQARRTTDPPSTVNRNFTLNCRMLLADPIGNLKSPLRLRTTSVEKSTEKVERADHPAIFETTYGRGKVIYLPFDASWMYFRYGQAFLARIMELALRDTASEPPPVEVTAPSIVQAMLHAQGDRLVVHLLNDISSMGRSQNVVGQSLYERREVIPIHDVRVTFRGSAQREIFLMPGKKRLTATATKDGFQVTLPPLEIHTMVVAEPAKK